ncbi:MAG: BlaI/MecI/CopY family transcriptional regulator [Akkermansiaceae bacterium]
MKKLSPSELEIMQVIWRDGSLSVKQLLTAINRSRPQPITRTTVLKQVQRLEVFGYLQRDDSRPALYSALVLEKDATQALTRDFAHQVFGGSPLKMVRSFFDDEKLKPSEVEELKELIRKLDSES